MSRPSFFIAGHSKSGTTALAEFLHQHPELFVCKPEEPNYFCPSWCRAPGPPSSFVRRSESQYLSLFDGARTGQRCGEASAAYLYSPEAAELIARFEPRARIVMIFREPVDFLRSYHLQLLKNAPAEGETERDLAAAIALEPARREGRELPRGCLVPELLLYASERLRYERHYDLFAARFPPEQLLALVYDDFRADNPGTVRRVFEFLGVAPGFEPRFEDHNSGGVALRSRRLERLLRGVTHSGGMLGHVRGLVPGRLRKRAIGSAYRLAYETPPPLPGELQELIRTRAHPHVVALGERLGRDLAREWGYRRPAGGALSPRPRSQAVAADRPRSPRRG